MTERKAVALAAALGGKALSTMPQSRMWGVALTRADGKYSLIEEDAGAVYYDEHACWIGYHTLGDDARGVVDAQEWGAWDGSERWARGLACILGASEYWHSGGNLWLVLYPRPDGRFAVIGEEVAGVYQNRGHWDGYPDNGHGEPDYHGWSSDSTS